MITDDHFRLIQDAIFRPGVQITVRLPVTDFSAWRKRNRPKMRRTSPVGIVHSGGVRTIVTCLCGARESYATNWGCTKRVAKWTSEHNAKCWPVEEITIEIK